MFYGAAVRWEKSKMSFAGCWKLSAVTGCILEIGWGPFLPLLTGSRFEPMQLFSRSAVCKRKVVPLQSEWSWDGLCPEVFRSHFGASSRNLVLMVSQDKLV